jgi:hypothetical protein
MAPNVVFRSATSVRGEYTMRDFGEIVELSARLNGHARRPVSFIEDGE